MNSVSEQQHQRRLLVDSLLNASSGRSPISSISSLVLFGTNVEHLADPSPSQANSPPSHDDRNGYSIPRAGGIRPPNPETELHNIALRNSVNALRHVHELLSSGGDRPLAEQSLLYRDLTTYLRDVGNLLAISREPTTSIGLVDVTVLLFLSIHLLATCTTGLLDLADEEVLESVTTLCGGFLSSYCGIQELAHAFEDLRLERAWLGCLFSDFLHEINFVTELRRRAGVLSWAEEIQRASHNIDFFPSVVLSRLDIGIATASLLDSWRTCQIILHLQLTNIEQIRRHSDIITNTCLDLAKLCSYDCGREALCAAVIDTPLPIFLVALEKHSTSQSMCETARYLTIQIFHTAVQFRALLSPTAEDALAHLFRHIEPSALSPILFCRPYSSILPSHIDVFLELLDHPHLLYTDVNFACQLYVVLSSLSTACATPAGCSQLISALSDLRLPYSSTAIACSALDEAINALSVLIHGEELPPGRLRYAKPPYPILPIDKPLNGTKILQQSDAKIFAFRSAMCLCELLLELYRFCCGAFEERYSNNRCLDEGSVRYMVQACIKTVHISRSFEGSVLSAAAKLERASLNILSTMTSAGFPPDVTESASVDRDIMELILIEILGEGGCSPGSCDTAARILSFIMTDWRSEEILINNRLLGSLRELLRKCGPEYSEQLYMWDGNCQQSRWLLAGGQEIMMRVWEEVLSRVEFWMKRGHARYVLKWLGVLRILLGRSSERRVALVDLERVLTEREPGVTLEDWIENLTRLLPETEVECLDEMKSIRAFCRGLSVSSDFQGPTEESDIDDLIFANCTDYLEDINPTDSSTTQQRPASPSNWRGRLSPEQGPNFIDDSQKFAGQSFIPGALGLRNVGGGKIYIQNEFRSAHGASRNTSRAPSVHVDDFYSSS